MSENANQTNTGGDLNLSYLNDVASGSVEFMIEMIDIFLEQTPAYFDTLTNAVQEKNWQVVADVAHKIKPTLTFMGVDKAREEMQVIERNARDQVNLETISGDLEIIKSLCASLFLKLEAYKKELESKL